MKFALTNIIPINVFSDLAYHLKLYFIHLEFLKCSTASAQNSFMKKKSHWKIHKTKEIYANMSNKITKKICYHGNLIEMCRL